MVTLVRLFPLLFDPFGVSGCHHVCATVRRVHLNPFRRHDGHAVCWGEVQRLHVSLHLDSTSGHCLEYVRASHVEVRVHRRAVVRYGCVNVGGGLVVMDGEVMRGVVTSRAGMCVEL